MNPSEDPFAEYRLPGDEKQKPIKFERETGDLSVHLPRRNQLPTTMSTEEYYGNKYQYGKRPKGWKR
mgnify:FL=1|jgi:hypothetical protein